MGHLFDPSGQAEEEQHPNGAANGHDADVEGELVQLVEIVGRVEVGDRDHLGRDEHQRCADEGRRNHAARDQVHVHVVLRGDNEDSWGGREGSVQKAKRAEIGRFGKVGSGVHDVDRLTSHQG